MRIEELLGAKPKTNYRVKVSDGNVANTYDVAEVVAYNDGFVLRYKAGGKLDVVYMSRNYRPLRESGILLVGKNAGNNSAAVLVDGIPVGVACDVVGRSTDKDCPGEDLSAIIRADGLALGFKALYESKIPWRLIVIVGIVAVIAVGVIAFLQSRGG